MCPPDPTTVEMISATTLMEGRARHLGTGYTIRFTLSAVSQPLSLSEGSTVDELRAALADSRVLAEATLVGTYER